MKAWITKYALTIGIQEVDGEVCSGISDRMFSYGRDYAHNNDWHRTEAAAIERAEEMRLAKIASHRKSIAKLEKMKFLARKREMEQADA